jgi:chromosome segregation ATPase
MDKQIIQDQINGITSRITTLRKDRDVHVRLQGLNVEAEKLRTEALDYSNQIEKEKVTISALLAQRQQIVQSTIVGLSKRMAKILPIGRPDIQITEDGGVYIGWVRPDGKKVAYAGLSGGEKALFDPALAYALKANVLLQESAELDSGRLVESLAKYNGEEIQVIVSTCHTPAEIPGEWKAVQL